MNVKERDAASFRHTMQELRQKKGMTLRDLAEKTGISSGFLSKIERGLSTLSDANFQKICEALQVSEETTPASSQYFMGKGLRELIYSFGDQVKLESIFVDRDHYKAESMTLSGDQAGPFTVKRRHARIGVVAYGAMRITLSGEQEHLLSEGDSLLIPADAEHSIQKMSQGDCVSYWFKLI